MGGQPVSLKRFIITNILILAVILTVTLLSFHEGVQEVIGKAAKAPVFTIKAQGNEVGLEVALCTDADFGECLRVLEEEGVRASIFLCPAMMEAHPEYQVEAEEAGFHTGLYDCPKHSADDDSDLWRDLVVLSDDAWDTNLLEPRGERALSWTLDANRALQAETATAFSEQIYQDCIILYRYHNDSAELQGLLKIIRQKGYTITDVKSFA